MKQRKEVWKAIVGFEDYEVSSFGRVRSVTPRKGARARTNGGVIRGWIVKNKNGSPVCVKVSLRAHGQTHQFRIHRLVLDAFIGPCDEGKIGCHNDGDPTNNRVENLRWDTHKSNSADMVRHGTRVNPPTHYGEAHHNTTLTEGQIREIRSTPITKGTKTMLAKRYGVAQITITRILNRDVWRHVE